jgi:hypothetical protein
VRNQTARMSPPRGRPINELFRYPVWRKRVNAVSTLGGSVEL